MNNARCEMCDGTGEGSGGWKGLCGYCDGTGEGTCRECRYPASSETPAVCLNHGVSYEGREHRRMLAAARLR
jgi:hypothetical protein